MLKKHFKLRRKLKDLLNKPDCGQKQREDHLMPQNPKLRICDFQLDP